MAVPPGEVVDRGDDDLSRQRLDGYLIDGGEGIATIAKSPSAAAWAGVAALAFGPRSLTSPASESGPWELLSTTSYPRAIAARARLLPTCPLPRIPMVVMLVPRPDEPATSPGFLPEESHT
jgi:hypothetical protein